MAQTRTLRLRSEVLGELTTSDLRQVVGAAAPTLPLNSCVFCVPRPSDCVCISDQRTECC